MHPELTVFTVGQAARDCRLAVAQLQAQTARRHLEVIVVTADPRGLDAALCVGFQRFDTLVVPRIEASGKVMALAVAAARAPFVAYAEEHQYLDPSWAQEVLQAHRAGHDVVGFAIDNANPGAVSWAQLYGQFGPAVGPVASGPADMLAGHHASYRRSLLLEYGELLPDMLEDESALFLDLRRRGRTLYMAGRAITRHVSISRLPALARLDYLGQRSFASSRAKVGGWSWRRRLLYAAAGPLIPLLRMHRAVRHMRRTGRVRSLLPTVIGPLACMTAAGAVGESLGYLFGPGRSALERTPFELERAGFLAAGDGWSKDDRPS